MLNKAVADGQFVVQNCPSIADAFSADAAVTNYVITGQDAEMASLKYIQDGKQSMTVWKDTSSLATSTCDLVNALLKDETPDASASYNNQAKDVPSTEVAVTVVDKDKLAELIAAGSFDQAKIDVAK